jgi:hypothetical protein
VGQKLVKFSDLSGELITEDDAVARIVIHEHPELGGAPVEIEVLADEARAVQKAAVKVALVEVYLPGEDEPSRVAMELEAFDQLATDAPMSELLVSARPARRPVKPREKRGSKDAEPAAGSASGNGSAPGADSAAGRTSAARAAASGAGPAAAPATAASLAAAGLHEPVANVA